MGMLEGHKGILFKVANAYCRDAEDRKDLVQETIYQLWKAFDRYDGTSKHSTWIYRIALNVAISFYRKGRAVHRATFPLDEGVLQVQEVVYDEAKEEHLRLLQEFIAELRELDKAVMLLYLEERSHREIAEIMGISESNVGTKIGRIKRALSDKFSNIQ